MLLIIQMQDATINTSTTTENTSAYGDGVPGDPGSGSTSLGSSGLFEFVTATNATPVTAAGGTVTFTGTGAGGGLLNTYVNAAAAPALNPAGRASNFPSDSRASIHFGDIELGPSGAAMERSDWRGSRAGR